MDNHNKIIDSFLSSDLNETVCEIEVSGKNFKINSENGQFLSQPNGHLILEIYLPHYPKEFNLPFRSGEIIREDNLFDIKAVTAHGLKFFSTRLSRPGLESNIPGFTKLTFHPHEITLSSDYSVDIGKSLIGNITPMDNIPTNSEYMVKNNNPIFGFESYEEWFKLELDGACLGLVKNEADSCHLAVWTKEEVEFSLEDYAEAFLQALSFRFGRRIELLAYTKNEGMLKETKLRKHSQKSSEFYPPFPTGSDRLRPGMGKGENDLLRKATLFFLNKDHKVILSSHASCWDSTTNYFSNKSLIAGVAVERLADNILNLPSFEEFIKEQKEFDNFKSSLVKVIDSSDDLKGNKFTKRIVNSISSISFLSPKDKIRKVGNKLKIEITEEEIKAWGDMRPPLAHGRGYYNLENQDEWQEKLDLLASTANIINKLVLALIRYEGPFADYSQRGWLTRNFVYKTMSE